MPQGHGVELMFIWLWDYSFFLFPKQCLKLLNKDTLSSLFSYLLPFCHLLYSIHSPSFTVDSSFSSIKTPLIILRESNTPVNKALETYLSESWHILFQKQSILAPNSHDYALDLTYQTTRQLHIFNFRCSTLQLALSMFRITSLTYFHCQNHLVLLSLPKSFGISTAPVHIFFSVIHFSILASLICFSNLGAISNHYNHFHCFLYWLSPNSKWILYLLSPHKNQSHSIWHGINYHTTKCTST